VSFAGFYTNPTHTLVIGDPFPRGGLVGQDFPELLDVAYEDEEGRLPHEPGYEYRPPGPIVEFSGPWAYMHNDYRLTVPLHMSGLAYPTVTHALLAAPTLDGEARQRIASAATVRFAHALAERTAPRHDWPLIRRECLDDLLDAKFADPWLKARLVASASRAIETPDVELNDALTELRSALIAGQDCERMRT
jgi:hypothetical protein